MKSMRSRLAQEIESSVPSGEQTDESIKSLADTAEALVVAADALVELVDSTWDGSMSANEAFDNLFRQVEILRAAKTAADRWKPC